MNSPLSGLCGVSLYSLAGKLPGTNFGTDCSSPSTLKLDWEETDSGERSASDCKVTSVAGMGESELWVKFIFAWLAVDHY